jgi:predicted TIM-barrel fold metal-dependent hydrolase
MLGRQKPPADKQESTEKIMATIDADAHVLESPQTWECMDAEFKRHTPMVVTQQTGETSYGSSGNVLREFWVVDGRIHNKQFNVGLDTSAESREMSDVQARLDHMKELQIDVQVLFPTLFLRPLTTNPEIDYALCKGYNRWLAQLNRAAPEELRWVVCPPLLSMDRVREELKFGKDNGACGIFIRAMEADRMASDPYFFPLYEMAAEFDMPITLHSGVASFTIHEAYRTDPGFNRFKLTGVGTFHDLLWNGIPQKFPKVRWGFIELSAQWVPYALNDLNLRLGRMGRDLGSDPLGDNNIYIACQVTDDLDYILDSVGDDNIVVGTDYGHNDTSTEIEALRRLRSDGKIPSSSADKILDGNAKRLYGLQ